MSSPTAAPVAQLSALRLVSFIRAERDAVHVGLLSPDAQQVIDLSGLGITDALEAIDQLDMLRQTAGAIVHGAARSAFDIGAVHLVAPIPLVRSVVQVGATDTPRFADPTTLHGPGGHLGRDDAGAAYAGLGAVVGMTLDVHSTPDDATLDRALIGTVLVLGWPQTGHDDFPEIRPGAVGPYVAVPRRRPDALMLTHVAPLSPGAPPDRKAALTAPGDDVFIALARRALLSHTLRPGDLLTIFPPMPEPTEQVSVASGSWVRLSAPGLGTLSLAVR